jgi:hypothetical protein
MNTRFKMVKVQPGAYKAMNALAQLLRRQTMDLLTRESLDVTQDV